MKHLIVLTITILLTLSGFSGIASIPNDDDSTTCLSNSELRQAIKLIEEGKLVKKELAITRLVVADQARRIEVKDSAIHILHKKDTAWQLMVISYQDAIKILREKDQLQMQFIGKLEKDLKRGKRKTLFTQIIAGVITIGAVVWAITK